MKILISACLLGTACRYDGTGGTLEALPELLRQHTLIPVCPEILGGLPTPRVPAEIRGGRVMTKDGRDVTAEFEKGAEEAVRLCSLLGCEAAILKERSPSCGFGRVYDGTFQGRLVSGDGLCAARLRTLGIPVYGESRAGEFLAEEREKNCISES